MKIYLGSPFFNQDQLERVKRVEAALEANPTVTEVFSPRTQQVDHLEHGSDEWRETVYNNDIKHVEWCDAIVAVHDYEDKYVDAGTAFEIGYAKAKGKLVILYQENDPKESPVNLMLTDSLDAYIQKAEDLQHYDFNEKKKIRFEQYYFDEVVE